MNVGEIEYTVSVETKKSIDASKKLNDSLAKSEKSLGKAGRGAKKFNTSLTPIAASIRNAFSPSNTRGIDSTAQQINSLRSAALRLASALGVAFSARAFGSMIKRNIDLANSTLDVATKLGTTTEELSKLRYAVAQTSGMASGDFDIALQRMTRRLAEAAQGGGVAKDAIEELGLSAKALSDMRPDEAFRLIMEQMSKLPDQTDRVRLAFKFFDSGGVALASTAKAGAAEINRLGGRLEELGGVIDTSTAQKAAELNAKLSDLQERAKGTGMSIANDAMPAIEDFVDLISDPKVAQNLGDIASAIVKVGGAAVNAASGLADFTRWAAESVAAFRHGAAPDDVVRLQDELKTYQDMLNNPLKRLRVGAAGQGFGKLFSKEEIEEQIALREKQIQAFYDTQTAAAGSAGSLKKETAAIQDNGIALGKNTEEREGATGAVGKQRDAAGELIKSLSLMNATLGMSQTEAALYRLKTEGATDAQIAHAAVLLENIDAFKQSEQAQQAYQHTVGSLTQELRLLALQGRELAQEQSVLQLGEYATDEQIRAVRELSGALYDARIEADELEARKRLFGSDVAGVITGSVSPLSGGMFDDQTERYEAEAQAEQQRYAEAMERLREAKELELEVKGGYMALEEQMAQEHADRMAQIEQAKNDMMMTQAADAFGSMASNLQDYVTTFGSENKELMAMMKASAIAQTIIQTYQGAQQAFTSLSSIPYVGPALGAAAAAAAVAGGMARVASIRAQGARRQGGPVSPGSMYRVNEGGKPEIFQNNLGQQYMMPNSRGEVISNKDASKGGGGIVINIHNAPQGTSAESSESPTGEQMIDIWIADFTSDGRTASVVQNKFGLAAQGR